MKALVIWESMMGTTRKAAGWPPRGCGRAGSRRPCPATPVDYGTLSAADLVVVGIWTDGIVVVGQKPGRGGRLRPLPYLHGKRAFIYCT